MFDVVFFKGRWIVRSSNDRRDDDICIEKNCTLEHAEHERDFSNRVSLTEEDAIDYLKNDDMVYKSA